MGEDSSIRRPMRYTTLSMMRMRLAPSFLGQDAEKRFTPNEISRNI
jgi:hypothetical protein